MRKFEIIAKTLFGLENVLASELKEIGATNIEVLNRAVKYRGDMELLYKSNLQLRTAITVLKPIESFFAWDEGRLYKKIRSMPWEDHFSIDQTFAINSTTFGKAFKHSKYVALKSKDAIVDRFREKYGKRPSVDTDDPDLRINIHISDNSCIVALDSSGDTLDKRGYRLERTEAPINEVLAAGIILLTSWNKKREFLDPMCGSGTFPIEAAMIAGNIPPGRLRSFAFEKWKDLDVNLWQNVKQEAEKQIQECPATILARDISIKAVEIAVENAKRAGVSDLVSFKQVNFLQSNPEGDDGLIIMNPPYGERLEMQDDIIELYKETGNRLKYNYNGWEAWVISSNLEAMKFIGLRPSKKIRLFNGPLECRLNRYDLYKGSRKDND